MKKIMLTLLAFSFLTTTYASTSQAEDNLIEAGNAVIEENEQLLSTVLNLEAQIKEKKISIGTNVVGAYVGGAMFLSFASNGIMRYTKGMATKSAGIISAKSLYLALGLGAVAGVTYNTYQIVVKVQDIAKFERLLDEKAAELQETISNTEVLLETLD